MSSQAKAALVFDQSLLVDGTYVDAIDVKTPITDAQNQLFTLTQFVSVSATDTHLKHLDDAITNGTNITKTILNPSGNATIRFDLSLASPGAIGGTTPAAGTFTNLVLNQSVAATSFINISGTTTAGASLISATGLVNQPTSGAALITAQAAFAPNAGVGFLYGILFIPKLQNSSNNVTNFYGIFARLDTSSSPAYTGTVANAASVYVATPSKASGTFTTAYGVFVETQTQGGTNFGIYDNDNLFIIGSRDVVQLAVRANGTQTNRLMEVQNSGGTFVSGIAANGRFVQAVNAGTPTGTPDNGTMVYDTTNNRLYVYNGGWKSVVLS